MLDDLDIKLRYVGARFNGAKLPLDVLADLPAFRDLVVAFAKDLWRKQNADRQRVPRGFDRSMSFDLTAIEDGSAIPNLTWDRESAQSCLPGFADAVGVIGHGPEDIHADRVAGQCQHANAENEKILWPEYNTE